MPFKFPDLYLICPKCDNLTDGRKESKLFNCELLIKKRCLINQEGGVIESTETSIIEKDPGDSNVKVYCSICNSLAIKYIKQNNNEV